MTISPFLLSRILLHLDGDASAVLADLSAVAHTPDGSLWLGSDELLTLERLSPLEEPHVFGQHQQFAIADYLDLFNQTDEIDIEGIDYAAPYLWFTGSHSKKRSQPKGKNPDKDIQRLAEVETDLNRYLIARIPLLGSDLLKSCSDPADPSRKLTAACLQTTHSSNLLMEALQDDLHLGPFVSMDLPSKENGLDIEGLAAHQNTLFLGLRGPVLRGWAMILEIELEDADPGYLTLKPIGDSKQRYKKHFVDLNGLGIRDLCLQGEDLIILAGPTMDMEGSMQMFRLCHALNRSGNTLCAQAPGELELLFDLPFTLGSDHAEGLTLFPCLGQSEGLLVVYDSPDEARIMGSGTIFADVFRLP